MEIKLNSKPLTLDHSINVAELLEMQKISTGGTAVAINGKIVRRSDWEMRMVNGGDDIVIISAAYGG
ncbi:MAG: sulfur carrier protein ThiS [Prevotella sp.]|nr:sulfur carrier protein ThiS [Prevotella sp.]MCM1075494.1 sulfur carrier protein ThiS [Ruminococcus sp.]